MNKEQFQSCYFITILEIVLTLRPPRILGAPYIPVNVFDEFCEIQPILCHPNRQSVKIQVQVQVQV